MENFLEKVKVNLNEDIERYFQNVEIESVRKVKSDGTLNFYLISSDIIPYNFLKDAEKSMAIQFLHLSEDEVENSCPFHIIMQYHLSSVYTPEAIFNECKKYLFDELKDSDRILSTIFNLAEYKFENEKLVITFDDNPIFKDKQNTLVDLLINIFKKRFCKDIEIEVKRVKKEINSLRPATIKFDENSTKTDSVEKNISNNDDGVTNISKSNRKRRFGFVDEGDILYGKQYTSKIKLRDMSIKDLVTEMDIISIKGIFYNYVTRDTKNGATLFTLSIFDGDGCINVKCWGIPDDRALFKNRFSLGDELKIDGKVVNDTYAHEYIIQPQCITKVSHRDIINFGKPESEDYYNIIITDRVDEEKEKRVELHLHTKASAQDAIGEVKQYIETARRFGMHAMAITDHGCVNALADAYEYINELKKTNKDPHIKIINGVEGYLVEDSRLIYHDENGNSSNKSHKIDGSYVIFDFEATGFNIKNDCIIKIEAKKIESFSVVDSISLLVKSTKPLSFEVKDRTGIKNENLADALDIKEALNKLLEFAGDSVFVTPRNNHIWNLPDVLKSNGIEKKVNIVDLITLARLMIKDLKANVKQNEKKEIIKAIAKELKVNVQGITDRKGDDRKKELLVSERIDLACPIFVNLFTTLKSKYEIDDITKLNEVLKIDDNFIKRQDYYHIILLAKNDVGRVNLYKIVSDSYVNYMYNKRPRIPRSLLSKYREGIIVGSACIAGEFMNAIKNGVDDETLKSMAAFYDYLEIQPTLNNSFLLIDDKENFKSNKDLEDLNRKVIEIADAIGKPVVATCDCHYVDKEDKIYREMLRIGTTWKKTNIDKDGNVKTEVTEGLEGSNMEELYFRTTKEMLDEFSYLGIDKAREVVIENTNLINNMIEDIIPLRKDKCPPKMKGSDDDLRKACYENLHRIYGDNPIKEITDRLENELKYIIDNGYSVMYMTAKKLIDYSKENGYQVGSRGSVGSSLVATLSGVSEVNPLPPHYICPKCHHIEYETEETKKYDNDSGFDMPDKRCPECGCDMDKNGVNIPFETFLGIPGDANAQKEPDIDLNFASVFQSKVHDKTIKIFGQTNTYKAGTVGTVASTTAFGYVKKFEELSKNNYTKAQRDFYKSKIIDCKNTTGQHPGGMIVVPEGEEIYTFTPINIAADKEGNAITTHFDYHKIDANLLKLDLLGHDSPLMLKKLSALTGTDSMDVPFYENEVLNLFKNTESLGISPADISGTKLGCLTIPEFGTDFAMNMCESAKPETVADLIRIAGLAHGTDVWQGNVQELIKNGDCTLSSAICCRDDIMIYLIEKGLDKGLAFNIMEKVRKGKGLTTSWEDEMRKHEVPEWYIGCCKKIKYMFPKAHAAAYVLASLRIAYYKIHYPREYYAAYFSIKKDGLDYKLIMQSREDIHHQIEKISRIMNERKEKDRSFAKKVADAEKPLRDIERAYKKLSGDDSNEEEIELSTEDFLTSKYESMSAKNLFDLFMCYRIVEEMKARGIDFCPIDIYKAKRSDFQVVDGKIMPSFDSIPGIGTKDDDYIQDLDLDKRSTALKCELEGMNGEYTSIEDFRRRTSVNQTISDEMKRLGLFEGIPDKEPLPIFAML